MVETFGMIKLPPDDEKIRSELLEDANRLLEEERIEVDYFTNDELVDFVLTWYIKGIFMTKEARALLSKYLEEEKCTVRNWIKKNYTFNRSYVLYEFSNYCGWLNSKEIIAHFGSSLSVFRSLYGDTPVWCNVPFHLLHRVAYTEIWTSYRIQTIRKWINDHWENAQMLLGQLVGVPSEDFPYIQGVEWHHVYTIYRRMLVEKSREDLRLWKEKNPDKYDELKERVKKESI